jgi:Asp/Glu/hydantoin racemase
MLGMVRVITLADANAVAAHGDLLTRTFGLEVVSACIPDQPEGIYDAATEAAAVPKIVDVARKLAGRGCDLIGISCAADPAVAEVRAAVPLPVIGAGSAAGHLARALSDRIGVLTILEDTPPNLLRLLGDAYAGMDRPAGVRTTLDLQTAAGRTAALAAAGRLIERGADTIVLGCTGFATMEFSKVLTREFGRSFIDPIIALGACAVAARGSPARR